MKSKYISLLESVILFCGVMSLAYTVTIGGELAVKLSLLLDVLVVLVDQYRAYSHIKELKEDVFSYDMSDLLGTEKCK